jgi:hypothetical protein
VLCAKSLRRSAEVTLWRTILVSPPGAPDLVADPLIRFVDRTFVVWALGGLGLAFGQGAAIGCSLAAGLTGLLWGGAVRLFVLHHVTYRPQPRSCAGAARAAESDGRADRPG